MIERRRNPGAPWRPPSVRAARIADAALWFMIGGVFSVVAVLILAAMFT